MTRTDGLDLETVDLSSPPAGVIDEGEIPARLIEALAAVGMTVGVAESCTGGLVGKMLTDPPGASVAFRGGIIAYDDEVKVARLGVPEEVIGRRGAVSEETALAMAKGAVALLDVDIAIGVTGIAGPTGGTPEKPVGLVWIALASRTSVGARSMLFEGDREAIRGAAASAALRLLLHYLTGPSTELSSQ